MSTTCTTCGADLEPDATACAVCGSAVSAGNSDATTTPPPPTAGATPPAPGTGQATYAGYVAPPHPSGLPADVRNWGLAAHLSAFAGAMVALAFVGPLIVWLLKRDEHPFIEHHAKEALNFNLSMLLYAAVSAILLLVLLGFLLLPAIGLVWLIFTVIAAVKASNGEGYRYPLTIRFVS